MGEIAITPSGNCNPAVWLPLTLNGGMQLETAIRSDSQVAREDSQVARGQINVRRQTNLHYPCNSAEWVQI